MDESWLLRPAGEKSVEAGHTSEDLVTRARKRSDGIRRGDPVTLAREESGGIARRGGDEGKAMKRVQAAVEGGGDTDAGLERAGAYLGRLVQAAAARGAAAVQKEGEGGGDQGKREEGRREGRGRGETVIEMAREERARQERRAEEMRVREERRRAGSLWSNNKVYRDRFGVIREYSGSDESEGGGRDEKIAPRKAGGIPRWAQREVAAFEGV